MGYLSREELEQAIKAGGSVMIGRRVISRLDDLPPQDEIDEVHAAKREYVTGLAEQAQQPPDRVPSASGPPTDAAPAPFSPPPPYDTPADEQPPAGDDAPAGKVKR